MGKWLIEECGNASSRTHEYGIRAKRAVSQARRYVAEVVGANSEEVLFTSGATESNNLAILGLAEWAEANQKKHIVTTSIEHDAVLAPVRWLRDKAGFDVTFLQTSRDGVISPEELQQALRPETSLVSIMHVNNETGVLQPISEFAAVLENHEAFFHVDAAQGFGKEFSQLKSPRIDLMSMTAHKLYGPQGIGALIVRRGAEREVPLKPLMYGGGQERGLRPGTHPVHLAVGLGLAVKMAIADHHKRTERNLSFRNALLTGLSELPLKLNGNQSRVLPHVINFSVSGVDSEAAMVALRNLAAVSNGSACTSARYEPSHVLSAMGLSKDEIEGSMRFSWSHLTPAPDWSAIQDTLKQFLD